jgi:hypothetical protein
MANNKDNQQTAKEVPMVYTPGSLRDVTLPSVRPFDMCGRIFGVGYCHQSSNNNCRNVHFGRLERVAICESEEEDDWAHR